jgi:zinc/manganese transport system substrate-binding protein/manganese/iron transport system substrate-binding protein
LAPGARLRVVATTNIVGDVVSNVGGQRIELTTLMDVGVDPHTYIPTPSNTAAIHDAHVVIANGAGLEADLEDIFSNAGGEAFQIHLSDGLELRQVPVGHEEEESADHGHDEDADPHVWFDVQNVIHWVATIEHTLAVLDPDGAAYYADQAAEYVLELERLEGWIEEQVASIPQGNRKLVTNHPSFGYLERYGLEQLGAVYPVNPSAEPSARDIAALEDAISEFGVLAVFTESTLNPDLAEQVARDTGIELVKLFSGSLGEPGSGAASYVELMQYDVNAIVEALR